MSLIKRRSKRPSRDRVVAVVVGLHGLCCCFAASSAMAFDDPFVVTATDESAADKASMAELRKVIEAIPDERRETDGASILEAWLPRFTSDVVRQRVLLSLGGLAQRQAHTENAIDFWRRAAVLEADPLLTARARELIADSISNSGDLDVALQELSRTPEPTRQLADAANLPAEVTDDIYNTEVKRIELLTRHLRFEDAFTRIVRLANLYPNHRTFPLVLAEGLTAGFFLTKDHESSVRWRRRIVEAIPYAAESDMFLGNAIAEKMSVGEKEEAATMMLDYIQRFPNKASTSSYSFTLAGYEQGKGNLDAARAFYRQAIASGKPDDQVTQIAEGILAELEGRPAPPTPIKPAATGWKPRSWVLVANISAVVGLLTWYALRRWAAPGAT